MNDFNSWQEDFFFQRAKFNVQLCSHTCYHRFVFFYNPSNSDALRLCVSSCPTNTTDFDASEYCVSTAPYEFLPGDEATVGETDFNIDANGCPTLSPATYDLLTFHLSLFSGCFSFIYSISNNWSSNSLFFFFSRVKEKQLHVVDWAWLCPCFQPCTKI